MKQEIKVSEAIELLKDVNQATVLLLLNCETLIDKNLVDERMLPVLKDNVAKLRSFYPL